MTKNIMCVEDNLDYTFFLNKAFQSIDQEFSVTTFESGIKALKSIKELKSNRKPNLIFLDLNLPDLSGLEILKNIKQSKSFSNIPVVILSSSNLSEEINRAYKLGANSYITKPSGYIELKTMLDNVTRFFIKE